VATARATAPLAAYVLHRWDWSETSLIVELFTRERGRIVVAAKGAKRPTSQLRPVLLPFQPLWAQLGKAPADDSSEVLNLRGAEWAGGVRLLGPAVLMSAYYLNELLLKLLARQDAHPGLYDAYADTLAALAEPGAPGDEAAALRAFELRLLREIGFLPELDAVTLSLQPLQAEARYGQHPESGQVPAPQGPPGRAWLGLHAALQHGSPAALRAACAPVATALRGPLREVLHYHLGSATLRTREVGRALQNLAEPAVR
jgi:DNA repair protein RecO (recombination protein O)